MALLKKSEAAQRLCINEKTLDRMIRRGALPAYRIGPKCIRIEEKDIEKYIASRQVAPVLQVRKKTPDRVCRYVPGMDVV